MEIKDVKVLVIQKEKLVDFLNINLKENQELSVDNFCIYASNFMIDGDCCFSEIQGTFVNGSITPILEIPCRIKTKTSNGYTIRMDRPDFTQFVLLSDLKPIMEEKNIIEFIRYNYNPRIQQNQNLLLKYIKSLK